MFVPRKDSNEMRQVGTIYYMYNDAYLARDAQAKNLSYSYIEFKSGPFVFWR